MNYKKELEDLIRMHNILKDSDDFYYASYMKDFFEIVIDRLKCED